MDAKSREERDRVSLAKINAVLEALERDGAYDLSAIERRPPPFNEISGIRVLDAVTVDLSYYVQHGLNLMDIVVDEDLRGRGYGSRALVGLLAVADDLDMSLNLYARSHGRSPLDSVDLGRWYERHGFESTPRGHRRPPPGENPGLKQEARLPPPFPGTLTPSR